MNRGLQRDIIEVRGPYLTFEVVGIFFVTLLTVFDYSSDVERKAEELPYHLECANDKDNLKKVLLSQDMFEQMYTDNSKQQLMKYWRFIGGYQIASSAYYDSLKQYIKVRIYQLN